MAKSGFAIKDEVFCTPDQGAGSPNHCHSHCLIVGALERIPTALSKNKSLRGYCQHVRCYVPWSSNNALQISLTRSVLRFLSWRSKGLTRFEMAVISMTGHKRDENFARATVILRTALRLMYALLLRGWRLRLRSVCFVSLWFRALVTCSSRRIGGAYDSTKHVPIHDAIIIIFGSRRRGSCVEYQSFWVITKRRE